MNPLDVGKGTYVAVKFDEFTLDSIQQLQDELKLLNKVKREDLHSTVVYSRVKIPYKTGHADIGNVLISQKQHLELWDTSDGKALVLVMDDAVKLKFRHDYAKILGATYDFPDYKPHITLSYNVGVQKINLYETNLNIVVNHEYMEDLDLDWAKDKK